MGVAVPRNSLASSLAQATTRAFLLSLVFSLIVGDLFKVVLLTFVSVALLPGFLSSRAHVLRWLFRGLAKVLDYIT